MSEEDSTEIDRSINEPERLSTLQWVRRGVMILVAIVAGIVFFRISAAFLPRWWANYVSDQVGEKFTAGTLWGLFYGFVFTFLPVLLFFQIRRRFLKWKAKLVVVLLAIALAAPNWLTLWVAMGNSNAAHAAERTFDVDVTGFRWATVIGAVAGAALAVLLSYSSIMASRRRKQVKDLKAQVRANQRADDEAAEEEQEG
ncbi:MAG: hypothetical protein ACXWXJ_08045 [Aeromicrobium sp.]